MITRVQEKVHEESAETDVRSTSENRKTLSEIINEAGITFFDANITSHPSKNSLFHTLKDLKDNPQSLDSTEVFTQELWKRFIYNRLVGGNIGKKRFVTTKDVLREIEKELELMSNYMHHQHVKISGKEKKHKTTSPKTSRLLGSLADYLLVDNDLVRIAKRNVYSPPDDKNLSMIRKIFSYLEVKKSRKIKIPDSPFSFLYKPINIPCSTDVDLISTAIYEGLYGENGSTALVTNDSGIHRTYKLFLRMLPSAIKVARQNGNSFEYDPIEFAKNLADNPLRTYADYYGGGIFRLIAGKKSHIEPIVKALS
ncbi:MAG: hypothetical protein Q8Q42_03720 [Nanoarchaeota archaeon]|nr:hypothetical protein [Nanoarchaeota archaeon]